VYTGNRNGHPLINRLKDILNQNELRAFRVIYEMGPISRVKITRILKLTRAAVTGITKRLEEVGLIMEVGKEASSNRRGRKEILLTVNPDAGLIVSIHIALHYFTIGLVNFSGKILTKKTMNYPSHSSPPEVLEPLVKTIRALLKENNLDPNKIFGIGVALPGIVNYEEGHLNENPFPEGWQGFKIRKYLEDQMETTVFIENDVKTLTLGEYQFGTGYHVNNMICLWLEDGIGVGLVHNGHLIRGTTSSAGEIGYSEFFVDLPFKKTILMDGSSRRWGDILSFTNLQNTIRRGIDQGWKTDLKKDSSIDDLIASALAKDPLALYILRLEGQFIGNIVMNLIYTFNPQVFLLVGLLFNKLPLLSEEIQKALSQGLLQSPLETLEMRTSNLGENGITVGGAALVLEHLFKAS